MEVNYSFLLHEIDKERHIYTSDIITEILTGRTEDSFMDLIKMQFALKYDDLHSGSTNGLCINGPELFTAINQIEQEKEVYMVLKDFFLEAIDTYLDFKILASFANRFLYCRLGKKESNLLFFNLFKVLNYNPPKNFNVTDYSNFLSKISINNYLLAIREKLLNIPNETSRSNEDRMKMLNTFLLSLDYKKFPKFQKDYLPCLFDYVLIDQQSNKYPRMDVKRRLLFPIFQIICPEWKLKSREQYEAENDDPKYISYYDYMVKTVKRKLS
jgi:hypothetical protein